MNIVICGLGLVFTARQRFGDRWLKNLGALKFHLAIFLNSGYAFQKTPGMNNTHYQLFFPGQEILVMVKLC
jgi:hypothetical protein